jgi:hypothetical protein
VAHYEYLQILRYTKVILLETVIDDEQGFRQPGVHDLYVYLSDVGGGTQFMSLNLTVTQKAGPSFGQIGTNRRSQQQNIRTIRAWVSLDSSTASTHMDSEVFGVPQRKLPLECG